MDSAPFDISKPSPPRMYDLLGGGNNHFAVDREETERLLKLNPDARACVAANRAFLAAAAGWAAGRGVFQYLDLGAGFPRAGMPHETVPGARVAYVDSDPVVASHLHRAVRGPGVAVVKADLRDRGAVLSAAGDAGMDLEGPVCALFGMVLHFLPADEAAKVVDEYVLRMARGSVIALSVWGTDDDQLAEEFTAAYPGQLYRHQRDVIEGWLSGLEVAEPGVTVAPSAIQPQRDGEPAPCGAGYVLIGVAVKP